MAAFAGGSGEVLTLQFGAASNHVGAHFWNTQDELLHTDREEDDGATHGQRQGLDEEEYSDSAVAVQRELRPEMLFKVGQAGAVPRAVVVDFQHCVGSLRPTGALMDSRPGAVFALSDAQLVEQARSLWSGNVEVHREPEAHKSDFVKWLEEQAYGVEQSALGAGGEPWNAKAGGEGADASDDREEDALERGDAPKQGDGEVADEDDIYWTHRVKEGDVRTWGDFFKAELHPRSVNLLHRYGDMDLASFTSGVEVAGPHSAAMEEIMDSIRFFLEECDRLQGVHCIVDVNGGLGAVAQSVLRDFRDDVKSCPQIVFGTVGPAPEAKSKGKQDLFLSRRDMNEALAMSSFTEDGALYVPMLLYGLRGVEACPYISQDRFRADSIYHTSFLGAAAIDCLSLPYRRSKPTHGPGSAVSMGELVGRLSPRDDVRLASLSMSLPFPFPDATPAELTTLFQSYAAPAAIKRSTALALSTVREWVPRDGLAEHTTFGSSLVLRGVTGRSGGAQEASLFERVLAEYAARSRPTLSPTPLCCGVRAAFPVTLATPDLFTNELLGPRGESKRRCTGEGRVAPPVSLPALCQLETSSRSGADVAHAHETVSRATLMTKFDFSKGKGGLDAEDFSHLSESLARMRDVYCNALADPREVPKDWQ